MTSLQAETRLEMMTQTQVEPKLTAPEIALLLEMFRRADSAGNLPGTTDWQPTYNLKAAASMGWQWKAAKASELVSADLDGERLSSNQVFDHCVQMAQMYSRRGAISLSIGK